MRTTTSLSKVRQEAEYKTIDIFKEKGYSVTMLCEVLDVSRSGYYKHKNRIKPEKEKQDELLCSLINEYHSTFDGILGYRRMTMFINKLNHKSFSEGYIHRLMNVLGITARIRRKKVNRIKVKPEYTKENILSRDFSAKAPNKKWLTDVTELSIPGDSRKLYLSPIMDLYDNSIIEYELSFKNNNHLVFSMFDKAIQKYPDAKPIFHSDRGFQYTGNIFKGKIEEAGMTQSMSRVGKCIDNGPMEGFFGTLKAEMFYGKKFRTLEELRGKIVEYIIFYNEKRFQKRLRCMAPLEYRNHASKCA
ncbi:MAG: IS3 family transposase [Tissierellia bacterium]|nr:IS3 family transposase [Tissierellia bacterium]